MENRKQSPLSGAVPVQLHVCLCLHLSVLVVTGEQISHKTVKHLHMLFICKHILYNCENSDLIMWTFS